MTDRQFTEQPFYNDDVMIWLTAVTRDVDDWLTMPVEQWGGFQHPDWRRPTALVLPA